MWPARLQGPADTVVAYRDIITETLVRSFAVMEGMEVAAMDETDDWARGLKGCVSGSRSVFAGSSRAGITQSARYGVNRAG